MHRYIKILLIQIILLFGSYFGLITLFDFLFEVELSSKNLFLSLFWSISMTIYFAVLIAISDSKVRKIARELSAESYNLKQQRTILLAMPFEKVFELCKDSISLIKKGKIKTEDITNGKIVATGWWSGSILTYEVEKIGEHLTRVEIRSQPALRTMQIDMGENLDNVQKISEFLTTRDAELYGKQFEAKMGSFVERYLKTKNAELGKEERYFVLACKHNFLRHKRNLKLRSR